MLLIQCEQSYTPSIDIFETFNELILMKRGGRIIYAGELGKHSSKLIQYFEEIPGVPKFNANRNPATWMLEVTGPSAEAQLGSDFAYLYNKSHLCCKFQNGGFGVTGFVQWYGP